MTTLLFIIMVMLAAGLISLNPQSKLAQHLTTGAYAITLISIGITLGTIAIHLSTKI